MHDFGRYDIYTEVAFICIYMYLAVNGKWFSDLYALKFKGYCQESNVYIKNDTLQKAEYFKPVCIENVCSLAI